jgi:hypothetical protein
MNTLILTAETANLSIAHLLKQMGGGGVEVRDAEGNVVAFVLPPADHEAWTYAEANLELNQHQDEVMRALGRRGGVTTAQLLANASTAAKEAAQQ